MLQANSTGALVPGTCSEEPGRRSPEWAPISAGPAACRRKASGRSASARGPQDVVVRYNGTAWRQATGSALRGAQFSDGRRGLWIGAEATAAGANAAIWAHVDRQPQAAQEGGRRLAGPGHGQLAAAWSRSRRR